MSINKVILVGNVGRDPEVRHIDSGVAVASFPLATTENYTSRSGERVSTTEWHNIVLWRNLAEVAEKYVKKGKQLYIEGRIRTRSYEDKEGNRKYITEIYGDVLKLLGSRDPQVPPSGPQSADASGKPASTQDADTTSPEPKPAGDQVKPSVAEETDFSSTEKDDDLPF